MLAAMAMAMFVGTYLIQAINDICQKTKILGDHFDWGGACFRKNKGEELQKGFGEERLVWV